MKPICLALTSAVGLFWLQPLHAEEGEQGPADASSAAKQSSPKESEALARARSIRASRLRDGSEVALVKSHWRP